MQASVAKYDPDQPRDGRGQWTSGGGGGGGGGPDHVREVARLNREIDGLDQRIKTANEFDRFDLHLQRAGLVAERDHHIAQSKLPSSSAPKPAPAATAPTTAAFSSPKTLTDEELHARWQNLGMSSTEHDALRSYTGGDYSIINTNLRRQDESRLGDRLKGHVDALDAVANRSRLPEETVTYRGVHHDALADLKPGDTIVDHGFVSTSVDPSVVANRFNERYVMHITSPAGTKAIPNPTTEKELVLGRGTAMRLDRKETRVTEGREQTILHMRVVGQR